MTDVLAERFAQFYDESDDSDWHDVRRRGRRRLRVASWLPAVALVIVAGALAAVGGWHIIDRGHGVSRATASVRFEGSVWRVELDLAPEGLGGLTVDLRDPRGRVALSSMGGMPTGHFVLLQSNALQRTGGAIVFGAASRRVASEGTVETPTVLANTKLGVRVWAVVVHGRARRIDAIGGSGRVLARVTVRGTESSVTGVHSMP
jgi:hypothetical protein